MCVKTNIIDEKSLTTIMLEGVSGLRSQLATVTAERDVARDNYNTLLEGIVVEINQRRAVTAERDQLKENAGQEMLAVLRERDAARDEVAKLREQYHELLYAVERAFPGESRHETALRYIRQAEAPCAEASLAASAPKEPTP